jgi:hypothetical protein
MKHLLLLSLLAIACVAASTSEVKTEQEGEIAGSYYSFEASFWYDGVQRNVTVEWNGREQSLVESLQRVASKTFGSEATSVRYMWGTRVTSFADKLNHVRAFFLLCHRFLFFFFLTDITEHHSSFCCVSCSRPEIIFWGFFLALSFLVTLPFASSDLSVCFPQETEFVVTKPGAAFVFQPGHVGRVQNVTLSDGQRVAVKTLATDPRAFLVSNLTSRDEVDLLNAMVKAIGSSVPPLSDVIRSKVSFKGAPYLFGNPTFKTVFDRVKELVNNENTFSEPEVWEYNIPLRKTRPYALDEAFRPFGHSHNRQIGVVLLWLSFAGEGTKSDIFLPVRTRLQISQANLAYALPFCIVGDKPGV